MTSTLTPYATNTIKKNHRIIFMTLSTVKTLGLSRVAPIIELISFNNNNHI